MIDAHCHPTEIPGFSPTGITIVATGFSPTSNRGVEALNKRFGVPFAIGVAPQTLKLEKVDIDSELSYVEEVGPNAIGEIGLDWKWAETEAEKAEQERVFSLFLSKARELDKPVVVHSRKAERRVVELIKGQPQAILHCFSGKNIEEALSTGAYFTIPPIRSSSRKELIKKAGLERLLVESDAPYIGKSPESVLESVSYIAEVLGIERGEAERATEKNSRTLFKL
ncbi:MAG: TatD family hydrolase [Candidatus Anstonellales archaeon]